jgi:hypothetical protein
LRVGEWLSAPLDWGYDTLWWSSWLRILATSYQICFPHFPVCAQLFVCCGDEHSDNQKKKFTSELSNISCLGKFFSSIFYVEH